MRAGCCCEAGRRHLCQQPSLDAGFPSIPTVCCRSYRLPAALTAAVAKSCLAKGLGLPGDDELGDNFACGRRQGDDVEKTGDAEDARYGHYQTLESWR